MHRAMCKLVFSLALSAGGLSAGGLPAMAQVLDVPFATRGGDGQAAWCASSTVAGLNPQGDGFLAVRTGPGTEYAKIDEVHNGDVVLTCDARGPWVGTSSMAVPGTRRAGFMAAG